MEPAFGCGRSPGGEAPDVKGQEGNGTRKCVWNRKDEVAVGRRVGVQCRHLDKHAVQTPAVTQSGEPVLEIRELCSAGRRL